MGVIKDDSILKGFSGRIDNLVFYNVNGKTCVRNATQDLSDPKTPKQLLQRNRLIGAQTFFQSVKGCILYEVFNRAAREQKSRSGYHYFLKLNTNVFGEGCYVDYSLMTLAAGSRQLPYDFTAGVNDEGQVELQWTNGREQSTALGTDRLLVAAVLPEEPFRAVMLEGVQAMRQDGHALVALPEGSRGKVHLYCFFGSKDLQTFSGNRYFCVTV